MDKSSNQSRYVAHFDMLGFKNAIARDQRKAWAALCGLRHCMDGVSNYVLEHIAEERFIPHRITTRIFSDTILVFTLSDQTDDLLSMVLLTAQLFSDALASQIPLRGAIAHGEFFVNDAFQLYCGVPFVKAYELGEQSQWCGIILDDVVADHFQNCSSTPLTVEGNIPTIVSWDVPLKTGEKRTSWVVNWPVIFQEGFKKHPPFSIEEYYEIFEPLLGPYSSLTASSKAKHQNTVDFLNTQYRALSKTPNEVPG